MPTLVNRLDDTEQVAAALRARDNILIREIETEPGCFSHEAGVFASWTRQVVVDATGASQTITYRTGIPHWGWLLDLVTRRTMRQPLPAAARPWWAPAQRFEPHDAATLARCATLAVVAGFLGALIGLTLTFVAADLGGDVSDQSTVLAVVRLGALVTAVAAALADRAGRRRVLGMCLAGAGIAAACTAAAPNLAAVAATQLVCRGLTAGAAILLAVVIAEELPAHSRAYGIAVIASAGGLGAGMVLWVLPLIDQAAWAWRPIHLLGLIGTAVVIATVRRLPETRRFERSEHLAEPVRRQINRTRFMIVAGGLLLLSVFTAPTQQLQNEYLRSARGFSATGITVFLLVTNVGGAAGLIVASRWSDRRSRRATYAVGLVGLAVGNSLMFNLSGPSMWVASAVGSIVGAAVVPSLGALQAELFPTMRRGTANGLINAIGVAGSVIGLLIVGNTVTNDRFGPTILILAICPLLAAVSLIALPETAGRELEELNPVDDTGRT